MYVFAAVDVNAIGPERASEIDEFRRRKARREIRKWENDELGALERAIRSRQVPRSADCTFAHFLAPIQTGDGVDLAVNEWNPSLAELPSWLDTELQDIVGKLGARETVDVSRSRIPALLVSVDTASEQSVQETVKAMSAEGFSNRRIKAWKESTTQLGRWKLTNSRGRGPTLGTVDQAIIIASFFNSFRGALRQGASQGYDLILEPLGRTCQFRLIDHEAAERLIMRGSVSDVEALRGTLETKFLSIFEKRLEGEIVSEESEVVAVLPEKDLVMLGDDPFEQIIAFYFLNAHDWTTRPAGSGILLRGEDLELATKIVRDFRRKEWDEMVLKQSLNMVRVMNPRDLLLRGLDGSSTRDTLVLDSLEKVLSRAGEPGKQLLVFFSY